MRRWAPPLAAALVTVVVAWLTLWLTHDRLYESVVVPGLAMEPTISRGDYVAVDHFSGGDPEVGDIVAYFPEVEGGGRFLSRVLAVAGQTVACCDQGRVVRDGKPLNETYADVVGQEPFCASGVSCVAGSPPVTVPPGRVFLASDNRTMSSDSRLVLISTEGSVVGVSLDRIDGRVLVVHSSFFSRLLVFGPSVLVGLVFGLVTFVGVRREVRQ